MEREAGSEEQEREGRKEGSEKKGDKWRIEEKERQEGSCCAALVIIKLEQDKITLHALFPFAFPVQRMVTHVAIEH